MKRYRIRKYSPIWWAKQVLFFAWILGGGYMLFVLAWAASGGLW